MGLANVVSKVADLGIGVFKGGVNLAKGVGNKLDTPIQYVLGKGVDVGGFVRDNRLTRGVVTQGGKLASHGGEFIHGLAETHFSPEFAAKLSGRASQAQSFVSRNASNLSGNVAAKLSDGAEYWQSLEGHQRTFVTTAALVAASQFRHNGELQEVGNNAVDATSPSPVHSAGYRQQNQIS